MINILWLGKFDGQRYRAEYSMSSVLPENYMFIPVDYQSDRRTLTELIRTAHCSIDVVFIQGGRGFDPSRIDCREPVVYFASEAGFDIAYPLIHTGRLSGVIAHTTNIRHHCIDQGVPCVRILNGYDPQLYYPIDCDKQYDIGFVGTMTTRRERLLIALKRYLSRSSIHSTTSYDPVETNRIYNESKIVVHFHAIDESYVPSRLFEVRATNALLVCEYIVDWHDDLIYGGFEMFHSAKFIFSLITRYLSDEPRRLQQVKRAQKINTLYTWENQMRKMLNFIERVI